MVIANLFGRGHLGYPAFSIAGAICHGQRGEIRKRYREGQEDRLV